MATLRYSVCKLIVAFILIIPACLGLVSSFLPALAQSEPTAADKQAAYCMEASFGYVNQHTRLLSILRENSNKGQAMLNRAGASPADKQQIAAQLKLLNDNIVANEALHKRWDANLRVFMDYLKRRGFLEGAKNLSLITSMSAEAGKDQVTVHETYLSCLRLCSPTDPACKGVCSDKANASDPSKRMRHCDEVVATFK